MRTAIKRWDTGDTIYEGEGDLRTVLEAAVAARADLWRADLRGASLYGARLDGARRSRESDRHASRPLARQRLPHARVRDAWHGRCGMDAGGRALAGRAEELSPSRWTLTAAGRMTLEDKR